MLKFEQLPAFTKDLKRQTKRFRTLPQDLELVKKAAIGLYHEHGLDNRSIFPIPGYSSEPVQVYKIKKIACRALKGKGSRTGLRIIYAYFPAESRVCLIQLYYKGDTENEDRERIKEYLKGV